MRNSWDDPPTELPAVNLRRRDDMFAPRDIINYDGFKKNFTLCIINARTDLDKFLGKKMY